MILITGVSGFIGSYLAKELVKKGLPFRVLVRSISSQEKMEELGYETVFGDVTEELSLEKAFEDVDIVFHLVGVVNPPKEHTLDEINRIGTRNVVRASEKFGAKRLIYVSSVAAGSDSKNNYELSVWGAEEEIRSSKKLEKIILRTSLVYGLNDLFITRFERIIKTIPVILPVPGKSMASFQPIFIDDLVSVLIGLSKLNMETNKLTLDMGGPEVLDLDSILKTLTLVIRKKRRLIHLPLWVIKPIIFLLNKLIKNSLITLNQIDLLQIDHLADNASLNNIFKEINLVEFKEGLRKIF